MLGCKFNTILQCMYTQIQLYELLLRVKRQICSQTIPKLSRASTRDFSYPKFGRMNIVPNLGQLKFAHFRPLANFQATSASIHKTGKHDKRRDKEKCTTLFPAFWWLVPWGKAPGTHWVEDQGSAFSDGPCRQQWCIKIMLGTASSWLTALPIDSEEE